jgi:hypothetical protein
MPMNLVAPANNIKGVETLWQFVESIKQTVSKSLYDEKPASLHFYLGNGEFTEDVIQKEFFGCAGVAKIDRLQKKLMHAS